ncbi:hypothetical protein BaRGS_00007703 [Batillaria attramentaria]|uniref:Uncharacterized protein n=1 Tax=Batillaria attramentaria TaxID=370345 RepID=A0ABD0LP23_9CAEN
MTAKLREVVDQTSWIYTTKMIITDLLFFSFGSPVIKTKLIYLTSTMGRGGEGDDCKTNDTAMPEVQSMTFERTGRTPTRTPQVD